MLRLTLAQMRRSLPRLAAAGVAILIGTAFVAASLLAGDVITRSTFDQIAARYAQADLVVGPPRNGSVMPADVEAVRSTDGVAAADGTLQRFLGFTHDHRTIWQPTIPLPSDQRLMPLELAHGAWPDAADQVVLPVDAAERLGVDVGGTVDVESWDREGERRVLDPLRVVGLVDDPLGSYARVGGVAVMQAPALAQRIEAEGARVAFSEALVVLDDGARVGDVRTALDAELPGGLTVQTPHEHAEAVAASLTGGQNLVFLIFVLTFAAIALLVAGLVITNTFQVLVAQRTRTLAMLRAVGAGKRQVGAGVLLEAAILGVVASAAGVAVGAGLGQLALTVADGSTGIAGTLPSHVSVTWQVALVPITVGTLVTVLAALVPARAATRVAPLAALRPDLGPSVEKGSAGRVRLVLSLLATFSGFALLALGAFSGTQRGDAEVGLLAGVAGGALSFVGVAVSSVFWMPRVASWAGRLVGLTGPTARLAAANTLRNPRRTAATSTALLIGVTLVAMMSTGAASARASLTAQLDNHYPIDLVLESMASVDEAGAEHQDPLSRDLVTAVGGADGVGAVAQATASNADLSSDAGDGFHAVTRVIAVDGAAARQVLNDPAMAAALKPGTVVVPGPIGRSWGLSHGDTLTLHGHALPDDDVTLTVVLAGGFGLGAPLVTLDDWTAAGMPAETTQLWASLDSLSAVGRIQDIVADSNEQVSTMGNAAERAQNETVIDTALGIVVGLLAVAVVIALIGVANTLSLSVLERRRESATLRAIGVTRGQLRRMLAVEGVLIAGVGAVLGIVLGLVYGWAGSLAALGVMGHVELSVPWRDVALVAVIALVAGLVASVLPGRSAVRPSPVAALATE